MSVKATLTNTGFFPASRRTCLQNLDRIFWFAQRFLAMSDAGVVCREVWKHSQLWPAKTLGNACQKLESVLHGSHHEFLRGEHSYGSDETWLMTPLKKHIQIWSAEFLVRIWGLTFVVKTVLLIYHIKETLWSSDKGSERKQDGSCSVSHFLFYGNRLAVIITYYLPFKLDLLPKK